MLHTFTNKVLFFLCSGTSELTEIQNVHIKKYLYCNHADTFLDPPKIVGINWWNFKNLNLANQAKRILHIV